MKDADGVRAALEKIKQTFAEHLPGGKWAIHAGTALSAYYGRDNADGGVVLQGDNDLDFVVLAETCSPEDFTEAFLAAGWKKGYFFKDKVYPQIGVVLRFFWNGVPFDAYWLYLRGRKRWWLTAPRVPHVLPACLYENLDEAKVLGVSLPVPTPLEAYCYNKWARVGEKFPDNPRKGEMLCLQPEWQVYDDQVIHRERYEAEKRV